jgi:fructose-specific phosphotransferase system IIC component
MQSFLGFVAAVFAFGYLALFVELSQQLPSQVWDRLLLPLLPIVVFTLVVLVALAFLAAKLDKIEQHILRLDK